MEQVEDSTNIEQQPVQTPTESSKSYMDGWHRTLIIGSHNISTAVSGAMAGKFYAEGNEQMALVAGIFTGLTVLSSSLAYRRAEGKRFISEFGIDAWNAHHQSKKK